MDFLPKLIVFDLDKTLTKSKARIDDEMSKLLCKLVEKVPVAIVSGGTFEQFEKQLVNDLSCASDECMLHMYLLPTSGAILYKWRMKYHDWEKVYENSLSKEEKKKITEAIEKVLKDVSFDIPDKTYGKQIEDRRTQITFSALGQLAPVEEKEKWDSDKSKRKELLNKLLKHIPEFEVTMGGSTSVDVTRKGVDKAYAIEKLKEMLGLQSDEILFFGDQLVLEGNDYPVVKTGVDSIQENSPEQTKEDIKKLLEVYNLFDARLIHNEDLRMMSEMDFEVLEKPWGGHKRFTLNKPSTVKILYILPNQEFSLQFHKRREEFWRILSGSAIVTIGGKKVEAKEGDEFFVGRFVKHRIRAKDKKVEVLEIALGEFDENDDIERLEDKYGRT